jgi:hypothetical protein
MLRMLTIFIATIFFCSPSFAQTLPAEIQSQCEAEWGTNYRMQLYCVEKQLDALNKLSKIKASSSNKGSNNILFIGIWNSASRTAGSITGNVRLSESKLDFESGESLEFSIVEISNSSGRVLGKFKGKYNPFLVYKNQLCSEKEWPTYIIFETTEDRRELSTYFFCGKIKPKLNFDVQNSEDLDGAYRYSGSYSYARADDQKNWTPRNSAEIERDRLNAFIQMFCNGKFDAEKESKKWSSCVKSETKAHDLITLELKYFAEDLGRKKFSICQDYTIAFRSTGSEEYISQIPTLRCLKTNDPNKVFSDCAMKVTGKKFVFDGHAIPNFEYESAEKIAACFNLKIK